jgi:hypothetical protein
MSIIYRLAKEGSSYTILASSNIPWRDEGLVLMDCVSVQPGTLDTRTRLRAVTQEPQRGERQDSGEVELRRYLGPKVGRSGRARPTSWGELHLGYKVAALGVVSSSGPRDGDTTHTPYRAELTALAYRRRSTEPYATLSRLLYPSASVFIIIFILGGNTFYGVHFMVNWPVPLPRSGGDYYRENTFYAARWPDTRGSG